MLRVTALIPFFGGESKAAPSHVHTRLDYLEQTRASMEDFEVVVGYCRDEDAEVGTLRLECESHWLPATLCRFAQEEIESDLFYVTEADQVLTLDRTLLSVPDERCYLVPHRLNQTREAATLTLDGVTFDLPNGAPEGEKEFYHPDLFHTAYGGAFLATSDLFRRVVFPNSEVCPVEEVTGFAINKVGTCFKTTDILRFYVEHLSHRDHIGL